MRKIIGVIILIVLSIGIYSIFNKNAVDNVKAINGFMDLSSYDFEKNGIVKLDGQWEIYDNELLSPEDIKSRSTNKYLTIPCKLDTQLNGLNTGYMTFRLRISAPEDIVYGFRIKGLLSASKVWINGVLQGEAGKVGESYEDEKAIYLPIYSYCTSKNGIVDIIIQTSNYRNIFPVIKSMEFGLKDKIMNQLLLDASIDLVIIGGLLVIELLFLSLYRRLRYNKSYLYFSILCLLIQLRCLFLNERIIVHFFPNMPYELLSKIAALTYYLWVPIYVFYLKQAFTDLSKRITAISSVFSIVFAFICITTNNIFYDRLAILSQVILTIILVNILSFLIKKVQEKEKNSEISLGAFLVLIVTAINDVLVNNGTLFTRYGFQIGMLIFAFLETYALTNNYCQQIDTSEKLKKQNECIYEKSIRDSLTNLYNRSYIEVILDRMIENYKKFGIEFTVLMLDIDHFKLINDTYGHPYGDKVLVTISNVLTKTLRETDYIGRYGGEEFIVIFPNTKKDKAKEIAERIRKNIANILWEEDIKITVSGGLHENNTPAKNECIKNADKLLYIAKEKGRNRIEILNL